MILPTDVISRFAPSRLLALAVALSLVGAGLLAAPAQAQEEEPEPERYEDVTWNAVVLTDFKSGKEDRAMEIIRDYFIPASKEAGTQIPRTIELQTGPWDIMFVSEMENGPSEMTWETSPESIEFRKAAQELHGEEKMQKIIEEYQSLHVRETSFMGYSGQHGAPITAYMPE